MSCVGDGGARSERSSNHRGLDDLSFGCACLERVAAVDIDAIRALRGERDGDSNQFLVFTGIAPSATAALSKAQKAFITSGARLSMILSLARFSLLYIYLVDVASRLTRTR